MFKLMGKKIIINYNFMTKIWDSMNTVRVATNLETVGKFEHLSRLVKSGNCDKWSGMLQYSSCTNNKKKREFSDFRTYFNLVHVCFCICFIVVKLS